MLMGVRERDCYWKSEGICFETLQCSYANTAPEGTLGKSQPCLFFCMILFTDFTGIFNLAIELGNFPFSYFITVDYV